LISGSGNIKEALRWGIINSNSVITKLGAQEGIVSKNQMHELLSKTKFNLR